MLRTIQRREHVVLVDIRTSKPAPKPTIFFCSRHTSGRVTHGMDSAFDTIPLSNETPSEEGVTTASWLWLYFVPESLSFLGSKSLF